LVLIKLRTLLSFAVCVTFLVGAATFARPSEPNAQKVKAPKIQNDTKNPSAETIAETVIAVYGGRQQLNSVRVNGIERANVMLPGPNGILQGQLTTRFVRKDKSSLDFKRIDLILQGSDSLSIGFNGAKLWSTLNGLQIEARPEQAKTFQASLIHTYTALLRYREDGSKVENKGQQTIMGLDCYVLLMTHDDGSQTTFFISTKSFRVLHADYELKLAGDTPTKFRVSYYEYKPIQNITVPMRTKVYENGQLTQEIITTSINFNIVIEDDVFNHG
jgi:hypothetical protein